MTSATYERLGASRCAQTNSSKMMALDALAVLRVVDVVGHALHSKL
jgi:hypothetical protein